MKGCITAMILLCLFSAAKSQDVFINTDSVAFPKVNLEEVVVNASKNNSKLKELPTSVTVLPSLVIENNIIGTLNQVGSLVPNFSMPDYGSKLTSPVYIRGVGSRINAPSVGLYVDNVPFFERAAFEFEFFDIASVEVLRGPQGTLFGRNSMGGLINILTKSPENFQGNQIKLLSGTYGNYKMNFGHYNKVGEKFAYSFAGNYQHNDGYYVNTFLDKKVDDLQSFGLRNRLIFKASDQVSFENIASFDNSKQGGYPYAVYNAEAEQLNDINYNQPSSYNRKLFSDALKFKYGGTNWTLSNTLSYQYLDDAQKIDQDFTEAQLYFVRQYQKQHMVANEAILNSFGNNRINWLFGVFGFLQYSDSDVDVDVYASDMWYLKTYGLDTRGLAVFNQAEFRLNDHWSLTAGWRFDYEASEMAYTYNGIRAGKNLPAQDTLYPKLKDQVFLPKLTLGYRVNKTNLYVSYSTGHKPGGYNSTFERPEQLMFKNETSFNFETGVKMPLVNNLFFTELAVFYTRLRDQQIYRTVPSGRGAYLDNSGLTENKGVEFSLKNREWHGLEGVISYGYTHSQILEYVQDENLNYNNKYTPYIPRHTFAAQLTKTFYLNRASFFESIRVNALLQQNGKLYWDLNNALQEDRYQMLNANVSFVKRNLQLDVWGKNLTNSKAHSFLFEALGNAYAQAAKPLHFGVSASVKF